MMADRSAQISESGGGLTLMLILSCFSAFLGAVCFGWNTGVINNPKDSIVTLINYTVVNRYSSNLDNAGVDFLWGVIVSIFAVGGMLGALVSGAWADKLGRRNGLLVNSAIGVVSALLMGLSDVAGSFEMLIAGRLTVGFSSALYTGLVPIYLAEVSPRKYRGGIGVLNQLGVVIGLFLSQALSLPNLLGGEQLWPVLMTLSGLPSLLQILTMPLCPESPRHLLLTKYDEESARNALTRLRGETAQIETELDDMRAELQQQQQQQQQQQGSNCGSLKRLFSQQWRPLLVGVVLHLSQQLSGINVIFYYSSTLFQSVGVDESTAKYATLAVGGIMIVMTGVSIPLMEILGRRTLHLTGLLGIAISSGLFTVLFVTDVEWASIAAALLVVVFFAVGPGSIPWMLMSEMFDQEMRAPASALGVLVNWSANFAVGILFSVLLSGLQRYVFVPFTVLTIAFLVFLYFWMPETKNKTVEEVNRAFRSKAAAAAAAAADERQSNHGESLGIVTAGGGHKNPAYTYNA